MSSQDPRPSKLAQDGTIGSESSDSMPVIGNSKSPYLTFTQVGKHWHGRRSLENVFVFGDSYSSRLGKLWTWKTGGDDPYDTDDDDATWINFFASTLLTHGRTVVKNFAFPGHFLEYDLGSQLGQFFEQSSKNIEPGEATFVFFLGINDCGGALEKNLSPLINVLIDAVRELYVRATARNFVLVDVPPTDRSPADKSSRHTTALARRIEAWNETLVTRAAEFASENAEVTMHVFSSHKVLSEILDKPGAYGFAEDAKDIVGRGIWRDNLHLMPAVHEIMARRVSGALG